MWYRHFNKQSWQFRLWRKNNLTFKFNDNGIGSNFVAGRIGQQIQAIWGTDQAQRVFNLVFAAGVIGLAGFLNEQIFGEKNRLKQKEQEERVKREQTEQLKNFSKNRFGVATNPAESFEIFTQFITNGQAIEELGEFNSSADAQKISSDLIEGLDSWMPAEDRRLLAYNRQSSSSHH